MGNGNVEQRTFQRAKVNWRVEYTGNSPSVGLIHEGSKLEDYSPTGACFLTMSDLRVGMELTLNISLPVRMAQPLVLKGVVVRVDSHVDIGGMFKAAAVKWLSPPRATKAEAPVGH